ADLHVQVADRDLCHRLVRRGQGGSVGVGIRGPCVDRDVADANHLATCTPAAEAIAWALAFASAMASARASACAALGFASPKPIEMFVAPPSWTMASNVLPTVSTLCHLTCSCSPAR